jgi:hypothetical protein
MVANCGVKTAKDSAGGYGGDWFKDGRQGQDACAAGLKIGGDWFSDPQSTCRKHGSKSKGRKMASAMIAKIPEPLARHIARAFREPL